MNIHLVYDSSSYKFDIQPNKTVEYLKDLACKIFGLKKEVTALLYNNNIITQDSSTIQIQNIFPKNDNSHVICIQSSSPNKDNSNQSNVKKEEVKQYPTKYTGDIIQIKEKLKKFDFSYQDITKEVNNFKIHIEHLIQNLINALQQFKENVVNIDTLLDTQKDFDDFGLIKGDIFNFIVEKEDTDNKRKIDIFNKKIDSYIEKMKKIEYRKNYHKFIYGVLEYRINYMKIFNMDLDTIYKNSNKGKYEIEINRLKSKYSTEKQEEKPELNQNSITNQPQNLIKKPNRKESLVKQSLHSKNLSMFDKPINTIGNIINKNKQEENKSKKKKNESIKSKPSFEQADSKTKDNSNKGKNMEKKPKLRDYLRQITLKSVGNVNQNDNNNLMKPSYLPMISSPKANKVPPLRILSPKNSSMYDDDDDNSQKSSNTISNKSRMSIFVGHYLHKKKCITGVSKYDFLI